MAITRYSPLGRSKVKDGQTRGSEDGLSDLKAGHGSRDGPQALGGDEEVGKHGEEWMHKRFRKER